MTTTEDAAFLVARFEPYVARAYWRAGQWLVGYSSPTEGPLESPVGRDMVTTPERALANLETHMRQIRAIGIRECGPVVWNALSREQAAALMSLIWSYGYVPVTVAPDVEKTALAIEARARDFNGRERARRKLESELYMGSMTWEKLQSSY